MLTQKEGHGIKLNKKAGYRTREQAGCDLICIEVGVWVCECVCLCVWESECKCIFRNIHKNIYQNVDRDYLWVVGKFSSFLFIFISVLCEFFYNEHIRLFQQWRALSCFFVTFMESLELARSHRETTLLFASWWKRGKGSWAVWL